MNDITALMATMKASAARAAAAISDYDRGRIDVLEKRLAVEEYEKLVSEPANVLALVEAMEKALADSSELKPANLINKFYERYPVASFKSESVRAEALGYFMAGAELQCFGEFVKYEELCSDE